jgi:hypothetical protein
MLFQGASVVPVNLTVRRLFYENLVRNRWGMDRYRGNLLGLDLPILSGNAENHDRSFG